MQQRVRFCTTPDGVRIAYATLGRGRPLVKAANWLTHLEFERESPIWRHWLTGLGRHHQLVRYDERGCGLSDRDVEAFSLDAWVRDLEAVVDALGLTRFALFGMSQGGPVAIRYAVAHPDKVSHLVLYGSYAQGASLRGGDPRQREEAQTLLELMRLGWGKDNPAFRQVFTSLFLPHGTPEQMRWFNELQRVSTSPESAVRFARAFHELDVSDIAPRVAAPTLVLHARGDARVPFEQGRRLASLIPGAQFVALDGDNHILLEGEPAWPRFLDEVHRFLGVAHPEPASVAGPQAFAGLTGREREVLELVAQGLGNDHIARRLFISPKTVRNHVSNLFSKLGVAGRPQAIVLAREAGLGRKAK